MAKRKIGRAASVARAYSLDDPRYERNSRVVVNQGRAAAASSRAVASGAAASPAGGTGNGPLAISANGQPIGSRGGLDFLSSRSMSVRQGDVSGGDRVAVTLSVADNDYGGITVSGGGTLWQVNPATILADIRKAVSLRL